MWAKSLHNSALNFTRWRTNRFGDLETSWKPPSVKFPGHWLSFLSCTSSQYAVFKYRTIWDRWAAVSAIITAAADKTAQNPGQSKKNESFSPFPTTFFLSCALIYDQIKNKIPNLLLLLCISFTLYLFYIFIVNFPHFVLFFYCSSPACLCIHIYSPLA